MDSNETQSNKPKGRTVKYIMVAGVIGLIAVSFWAFKAPAQNEASAQSTHVNTKSVEATELQFTVYKSASCGCCINWNDQLRQQGHKVTAHNTNKLYEYKTSVGVPDDLQSCHTAMVGGYVIEGHVPLKEIEKLLRERPDAIGLSVPGMVSGSPGMENGRYAPYDVILFYKDGKTEIYASY